MSNPSPACTVNGSTPPKSVTANSTVTIALANPAGATFWALACTSTDELNTAAAINATLVINQSAKTATFTAPASLGSAVIFTSTVGITQAAVGQGYDANNVLQASFSTTFEVNVLASSGLNVIATNESFEGNATYGWITKVNGLMRNPAAFPSGSWSGEPLTWNGSAWAAGTGATLHGNLVVADATPTTRGTIDTAHGLATFGGGGSDHLAAIGPLPGSETTYSSVFLLGNGGTPSGSNYAVTGDGTTTWLNAPSGSINFNFAAVTRASIEGVHGRGSFGNSGTDRLAIIGPMAGNETALAALYLLANGGTPSTSNYAVTSDGSTTWINAPGATINFNIGANNYASVTTTAFTLATILLATPAQALTLANGANNNVTLTRSYARITGPTAVYNITGFSGGVDGARLTIYNTVAQTLTISNLNAGSSAANQIRTLTGSDVALRTTATSSASFIYDGTESHWILVGTS